MSKIAVKADKQDWSVSDCVIAGHCNEACRLETWLDKDVSDVALTGKVDVRLRLPVWLQRERQLFL